jgi:Fe-S-cluster containining protein
VINQSQFTQREYEIASEELANSTPQKSLGAFYRRHDSVVIQAIERSSVKPACRAKCSYCCHYKVEARAVEVLALQQYVMSNFKPERIRQIIEQATRNVEEAKNLTHTEHLTTNQRCPFLFDDQCAVYHVRPSKCRNFHAADMNGCRSSYEQPANLEIPNSYIPEFYSAANGTTEGFELATEEAGLDPRVYDLNSAFIEAMRSSQAAKRLKSGKRTFVKATVVHVPVSAI